MNKLFCFSLASLLLTSAIHADEAEKHFAVRVLPLLKTKCFACHGGDSDDIKGKYVLTGRQQLIKGGESDEPAVVVGKPTQSPLVEAIKWNDLEMPPKENDRLTVTQISYIEKWIRTGAVWPKKETIARYQAQWAKSQADGITVQTSGGLDSTWTNRRYVPGDLWAYRPISNPPLPLQGLHPIDSFIQARLKQRQLASAPRASKAMLLRRIYYDLTGLPPTPKQAQQFMADDRPQAVELLVQRLLDSPRYGEKWAQHWLDITRYADTSGFSRDDPRPTAWRYRDYVIRAFNDDMPFDQFIVEQIAGDELDESNSQYQIAVGYLRMGPYEHTGMSVAAVTRQQYLDDTTNAIGETFLGQVLRCAKCHDHKFDPIPTRDYYRMVAILAPLHPADRQTKFSKDENTAGFDLYRRRHEQLLARARAENKEINDRGYQAKAQFLQDKGIVTKGKNIGKLISALPKDQQPQRHLGLSYTDLGVLKVLKKRVEYLSRMLKTYQGQSLSVYSGSSNQYSSNKEWNAVPQNRKGTIVPVSILTGGSIQTPGEQVTPGILSAAGLQPKGNATHIATEMTGRRVDLAKWIANRDNPFTARVLVNRVWQHHFGNRGIVSTPNNLGTTGSRPTHPELLDHLASWFMQHGWSVKKLHAYIMSSEAYQRSATHPKMQSLAEKDPDNQLLAYYPVRRLTAEELRDSMLAVSGELDTTMGGPGIYPEINREVAVQPIHVMGSVAPAWQPSLTPAERNRRTIYVYKQRNRAYPMQEVFNKPESTTSCDRRDQTTVVPQAFTLLNSQNTHDRALAMAARIARQKKLPRQKIIHAFQIALGRTPTESQLAGVLQHYEKMLVHHRQHLPVKVSKPTEIVREMTEEMTGEDFSWTEQLDIYSHPGYIPDLQPWDVAAEVRALAEVCLVLFNCNEFVYVY
ncbi:MAG: PSD1 and planctomycete cytochrome C domain-containing protein [Pirellulales bacterium]